MRIRDRLPCLVAMVLISLLLPAAGAVADRMAENVDTEAHILERSAFVPDRLSYQGYLADASDSSAVTATLEMTFRLYDSETKGAELWSETHPAVEVQGGLFQVFLGSATPFPGGLFDGTPLWLQTEVGTEVLVPRKPLVSVAYSQMAGQADQAATADFAADAQHAVHADTANWTEATQYAVHADTAAYCPSSAIWSTAGDDIYRPTGKVGIGTATPVFDLDVAGSISADTLFGDGSNLTGLAAAADSDWTLSGHHMYAAVPGSVGIGTSTPGAKLEVAGSVEADGFTINGVPVGSSSDTYWSAGGSDIYYSAGDVGIGTSTPGQPLDVLGDVMVGGDSTAHDGGGEVVVFRGESGDWRVGVQNELTEEESDFFIGLTSSEDGTFHIERGGNVGIGTTEPAAKLDVRNLPLMGRANAVYGKGGSVLDPTEGYVGQEDYGVVGRDLDSENWGYLGGGVRGAYGRYGTSGNYGYLGGNTLGAYGQHAGTGNWGELGSSSTGVRGSGSSYGVKGEQASSGNFGYLGGELNSVYGLHNNSGNFGLLASGDYGCYGEYAGSSTYGYLGGWQAGVYGAHADSGNYGMLGTSLFGVYGYKQSFPGYAGYFDGVLRAEYTLEVDWSADFYHNAWIAGDLMVEGYILNKKGAGVSDHPLDPENKLLRHNFLESPERLVVYRGSARLDGDGQTEVAMPDYFVALTAEDGATVSLTPVGRPFPVGYEWLAGQDRFRIYGQSDGEVAWMVMAQRDDPVARNSRRPVEEDKGPDNELCNRGELLDPEAHGYPAHMKVGYDRRARSKQRAKAVAEELSRIRK